MSRLMVVSDLHLGHNNICKYRPFNSAEEHHEILYDNLISNINKQDSLIMLRGMAFTLDWYKKLGDIQCIKKH